MPSPPIRRRAAIRAARAVLHVTAALLSLAAVCGSGWAWWTYRNLDSSIPRVDVLPGVGPSGPNVVDDGDDQNILLLGSDDRSTATPEQLAALGTTYDDGSMLTDSMLLLHVPADGSRATLISFPRDAWVAIPGVGEDKLNAAYGYGSNQGADPAAGFALLIKTLQNLTGLTIDHFAQIDLLGFYTISNAIGGIDINMCEAQNASTEADDTHPNGYSGINLKQGWNYDVKGSQALAFVRQRHGLDDYGGDLQRERRQQYFLTQVFKKFQSAGVLLNPFKIQDLMGAISGSLTMDRTMDLLQLARQMANLSAGNILSADIPITGPGVSPDGQDVLDVDYTALPDFIAGIIGRSDPAYDAAAPADAAGVAVDIVNSSGVDGLASANAAALRQAGFATTPVRVADLTTATAIHYPDGMQAQAKALAAL
ncbi:MAG: LCP family protein, partial [Frankiaceae bacterium]|nr:LCP family protein [Frankiaceae bacterium]